MSSGGRYVRAPDFSSDSEDLEEYSGEWPNDEINGVQPEQTDESDAYSTNEALGSDVEDDDEQSDATCRNADTRTSRELAALRIENQAYIRRMERMESQLNQLIQGYNTNQPRATVGSTEAPVLRDIDHSWNTGVDTPGPSTSTSSFRWENIQPFPNEVPANRMWEQWNRFIDRFEIATSLSNVNDPAKRSQMLFLSMGEKLQGIVNAARLRPSLQVPNCYNIFVKNIENYLQSMVDITAEHETFSNLRQGPDEPTITFHARLMEKVRLCRYSSADEDRFVRMQLLKGMRNRELAKTARTFRYETGFIVQSATREEAFEAETTPSGSPRAFAVTRERQTSFSDTLQRKRRYVASSDGRSQAKKQRTGYGSKNHGSGRRSRCSKCSRMYHKFGTCPAENRKCDACGNTGHFAVACWNTKTANHVQTQKDHEAGWPDENENEKKVNND